MRCLVIHYQITSSAITFVLQLIFEEISITEHNHEVQINLNLQRLFFLMPHSIISFM